MTVYLVILGYDAVKVPRNPSNCCGIASRCKNVTAKVHMLVEKCVCNANHPKSGFVRDCSKTIPGELTIVFILKQ